MTELLRVRNRASHLSADPSDLAAWLHERWRRGELPREAGELIERLARGELSPERIRLAAYLGDPVALALDGEEVVSLASYLGRGLEVVPLVLGEAAGCVRTWLRHLELWDARWLVVAQWVLAGEEVRAFAASLGDRPEPDPYGYGGWEAELERARRALARAGDWLEQVTPGDRTLDPSWVWALSHFPHLQGALDLCAGFVPVSAGTQVERSPEGAHATWFGRLAVEDDDYASADRVRAALIPWALGRAPWEG